ncbi:acyl-CoA N-acyltransferase [Exidia glandulosa HHB12029]|uniref:Glucosamine 6-phosphate N-acetyltransferase n=1 Tax=Exidia glandulosa HHB12029 TaxID=1314781 RepID=A0A165NI71_EXIGL|nr:acyl-CoA N-acyltransferase [Exidia glandulosa HHB12029]
MEQAAVSDATTASNRNEAGDPFPKPRDAENMFSDSMENPPFSKFVSQAPARLSHPMVAAEFSSLHIHDLKMPLTPETELDLLFNPLLIPQAVREALPRELHIRPQASSDHLRSHLTVLSVLSPTPTVAPGEYERQFHAQRACPDTYYTLVILNRETDQIVATGTLFVERKFLRGLGLVGHIEDVAVSTSQQGKKLGFRITQALVGISEGRGCYKTIGNCSTDNIPFYEKCGFRLKDHEMAKYTKDTPQMQKL